MNILPKMVALLAAGAFSTVVAADESRITYQDAAQFTQEFNRCDQHVLYFKPHGKYPSLLKFIPGASQLTSFACGC